MASFGVNPFGGGIRTPGPPMGGRGPARPGPRPMGMGAGTGVGGPNRPTGTAQQPIQAFPMPSPSGPAGGGAPSFVPNASSFGSGPYTGTSNPGGEGPIVANPGNAMVKPGQTSTKSLSTALGNAYNYNLGTQGALLNENENALNLNGLQNTPLYKGNLATTEESIGSNYDQAIANARRNAISAGFGYASPVAQGADTQLRGAEAGEMSRAPGKALLQTVQPTLQAAGIRSNEMSQFNPTNDLSLMEQLVQGNNQSKAGMMQGLMSAISNMGSTAMEMNPGGIFGP